MSHLQPELMGAAVKVIESNAPVIAIKLRSEASSRKARFICSGGDVER